MGRCNSSNPNHARRYQQGGEPIEAAVVKRNPVFSAVVEAGVTAQLMAASVSTMVSVKDTGVSGLGEAYLVGRK